LSTFAGGWRSSASSEAPPEACRERLADRRFAGAGDAHDHDDHAQAAESTARVARDHQVLVGRHDLHGARAVADDRVVACVPVGTIRIPEVLEPATHLGAHLVTMLADSAREDEGVEPAEHGGERSDVFPHLVAEELDRLRRGGVRRTLIDERLHVGRRPGDAEETRLVIDEPLERGRIMSLVGEKMDEHAGIEVARARAHHDAAGRREAHRRVDRRAVAHGRQAAACRGARDGARASRPTVATTYS
jgi:hypothetical protein